MSHNYGDLLQIRNAAGWPMTHPFRRFCPTCRPISLTGNLTPALDTISSYIGMSPTVSPPSDNPMAEIKQIRMYRVTHLLLSVEQFKKGIDPKASSTYLPYFYGDYDKEGKN